jgi:hypothetical protein
VALRGAPTFPLAACRKHACEFENQPESLRIIAQQIDNPLYSRSVFHVADV